MECIGETFVELKNNISKEQKEKIYQIFNDVYGNIEYIEHIKDLDYKGDRGCIGVFACEIIDNLKQENLLNLLSKYEIYNYNSKIKEDYLIDE